MRAFGLIVTIALGSIGCGLTGPSDDLTGFWMAQGAGHTLLFGLDLQQSGDTIRGTACGSSQGTIFFRDVPVTGTYPRVQFTASADQRFSGKQDSTMDIVGSYANGDLRFKRSDTNLCK